MAATSSETIRPHRRSLWLGVMLAPWSGPFALAALAVVWEGASANAVLELLIFATAFGLPITFAGMLLFGLPLTLWLRSRGELAAWRLCLIAPVAGSLAFVVGLAAFGGKLGTLAQVGLGAILGFVVAVTFCFVSGIPWREARGLN